MAYSYQASAAYDPSYNLQQQAPQEYDPAQPFYYPQAPAQAPVQAGVAFFHNQHVPIVPPGEQACVQPPSALDSSGQPVPLKHPTINDDDEMEDGELESDEEPYSPPPESLIAQTMAVKGAAVNGSIAHKQSPQPNPPAPIRRESGVVEDTTCSIPESELWSPSYFREQKEKFKPMIAILYRNNYGFDELVKDGFHEGLLKDLYMELKLPLRPPPKQINGQKHAPPPSAPKPQPQLDRAAYLAQLQAAKNKRSTAASTARSPVSIEKPATDGSSASVTKNISSVAAERQAHLARLREEALKSAKKAQAQKALQAQAQAKAQVQADAQAHAQARARSQVLDSATAQSVSLAAPPGASAHSGVASAAQLRKRPVAADFDDFSARPRAKRPFQPGHEAGESCIIEASDDEGESDDDAQQTSSVSLVTIESRTAEMRRKINAIEERKRQAQIALATSTSEVNNPATPASLSSPITANRGDSVSAGFTPSNSSRSKEDFKAQQLAQFRRKMQQKAAEKQEKNFILEELKALGMYEEEFEEGDLDTLKSILDEAKAAFEEEENRQALAAEQSKEACAVGGKEGTSKPSSQVDTDASSPSSSPAALSISASAPLDTSRAVSEAVEALIEEDDNETSEPGEDSDEDAMQIEEVGGVAIVETHVVTPAAISIASSNEDVAPDNDPMDISESDSSEDSDEDSEEAIRRSGSTKPDAGPRAATHQPEAVQQNAVDPMPAPYMLAGGALDIAEPVDDDDDDFYEQPSGDVAQPLEAPTGQPSAAYDALSDSSEEDGRVSRRGTEQSPKPSNHPATRVGDTSESNGLSTKPSSFVVDEDDDEDLYGTESTPVQVVASQSLHSGADSVETAKERAAGHKVEQAVAENREDNSGKPRDSMPQGETIALHDGEEKEGDETEDGHEGSDDDDEEEEEGDDDEDDYEPPDVRAEEAAHPHTIADADPGSDADEDADDDADADTDADDDEHGIYEPADAPSAPPQKLDTSPGGSLTVQLPGAAEHNVPAEREPEAAALTAISERFTPYISPLSQSRKHGGCSADPKLQLCKFEGAGGVCNDAQCASLHFRDLISASD